MQNLPLRSLFGAPSDGPIRLLGLVPLFVAFALLGFVAWLGVRSVDEPGQEIWSSELSSTASIPVAEAAGPSTD